MNKTTSRQMYAISSSVDVRRKNKKEKEHNKQRHVKKAARGYVYLYTCIGADPGNLGCPSLVILLLMIKKHQN